MASIIARTRADVFQHDIQHNIAITDGFFFVKRIILRTILYTDVEYRCDLSCVILIDWKLLNRIIIPAVSFINEI